MLQSTSSAWMRVAALLVPSALAATVAASCSGAGDASPEGGSGGGGGGGTAQDGSVYYPDVTLVDGATQAVLEGGVVQQTLVTWGRDPWPDGERTYIDSDTVSDPAIADQFAAEPGSGPAPAWSYPFDGSLHPSNLPFIELHWTKGDSANTLFHIQADAPDNDYHLYFGCTTPACAIPVPQPEWIALGQTYMGQTVQLTVEESDGQGTITRSQPISIAFSDEDVRGVLYYWAANTGGIKRANFGSPQAVDFIMPNTPENGFLCAACHAVSRDGSTIAFAVAQRDGESTAAIQTAPTMDPAQPYVRPTMGDTPFDPNTNPTANPDLTHQDYPVPVTVGPTDYLGHNVALSPDGSVAAINGVDPEDPGNWPPWFELRDTRTGATLLKIDLGQTPFAPGTMPILSEWHPNGNQIVATLTDEAGGCAWTYATCTGGIVVMDVDPAGTWVGAPTTLVEAAPNQFHYYPTWSPAGDYVAFMTASDTGGTKSDLVENAVLNLVPATGGPHVCPGPTCYQLSNAMHVEPSTNPHTTWPKFAPFAQPQGVGNLLFIAFTSEMQFGVRPNTGNTQIWMAGVDLTRLPEEDPSYAPVWLPYQQPQDGSLAPYWAMVAPCNAEGGDCDGCRDYEVCSVDPVLNLCTCTANIPE